MRVIGDTIFSVGAVALGWFVVGLKTGHSVESREDLTQERYPSATSGGPPPRTIPS
jgi:nitric oxide reductase subunit B